MSDNNLVHAATLDLIADVVKDIACVQIGNLSPFTTLLVRTVNSLYRVVIGQGPDVYVQGGVFFPEVTSAYLDGASIGGSWLKVGCICVGLLLEIRSGGRRVVTSPVLAITVLRASGSAVH